MDTTIDEARDSENCNVNLESNLFLDLNCAPNRVFLQLFVIHHVIKWSFLEFSAKAKRDFAH